MYRSKASSFLVIILFGYLKQSRLADAHGTLLDPVSRNSLWRIDHTAPKNYDDIELFCGGIGVSTTAQVGAMLVVPALTCIAVY